MEEHSKPTSSLNNGVSFTLIYFSGRGKAELTRWLFAAAQVEFKDQRVTLSEWKNMKKDHPEWLDQQLPILLINDKPIFRSLDIAKFVAEQFGLCGRNLFEKERADELVQDVVNLYQAFDRPVRAALARDEARKNMEWMKFKESRLREFLDEYTSLLDSSDGSWFAGKTFTWADIAVAEVLTRFEDCFDVLTLKEYPKLKAHSEKLLKLTGIKNYIEHRPRSVF